ncbi:MAG: hypothetical protein M1822_008051 [Bathelium mastoideum]|nr:MAG: hypothetical protein M1822_008051 [Bathelium mastoideum]
MDENSLESFQLVLALHTVVDYINRQGAGLGIVQQAEYAATDIFEKQLIPDQELKYGFNAEKLVFENIRSPARAHMLALVHALGLAKRTIKRYSLQTTKVQKIQVYSDSSEVVQTVNHHISHAPTSLANVTSTYDRLMVRRVVTKAQQLSRQGFKVYITDSGEKSKGWERARVIARQKGRQACKSRRQSQRTHIGQPLKEQKEVGDKGTPKGTFELVIRTKDTPTLLH